MTDILIWLACFGLAYIPAYFNYRVRKRWVDDYTASQRHILDMAKLLSRKR